VLRTYPLEIQEFLEITLKLNSRHRIDISKPDRAEFLPLLSEVQPQAADNEQPENGLGDGLRYPSFVMNPVRERNWRSEYYCQNAKSILLFPSGHRSKCPNELVKWLSRHHLSPCLIPKRTDFLEMVIIEST
jgi:hypothetical protein